jgi:hypothetical protein
MCAVKSRIVLCTKSVLTAHVANALTSVFMKIDKTRSAPVIKTTRLCAGTMTKAMSVASGVLETYAATKFIARCFRISPSDL